MERLASEIHRLVEKALRPEDDEIKFCGGQSNDCGDRRTPPSFTADNDNEIHESSLTSTNGCVHHLLGWEYRNRLVYRSLDRALASLQHELACASSSGSDGNGGGSVASNSLQGGTSGAFPTTPLLPEALLKDLTELLMHLQLTSSPPPFGKSEGGATGADELVRRILRRSANVLQQQEEQRCGDDDGSVLTPETFRIILHRIAMIGGVGGSSDGNDVDAGTLEAASPEPDWRTLTAMLDLVTEALKHLGHRATSAATSGDEREGGHRDSDGGGIMHDGSSSDDGETQEEDLAGESLSLLFQFLPRAIQTLSACGWHDMVAAATSSSSSEAPADAMEVAAHEHRSSNRVPNGGTIDVLQVDGYVNWRLVTGFLMEEVLSAPFREGPRERRQHPTDDVDRVAVLDRWLVELVSGWSRARGSNQHRDEGDGQGEDGPATCNGETTDDDVRETVNHLYKLLDQYIPQLVAFAVDVMDGASILVTNSHRDPNPLVESWAIDECLRQVGMATEALQCVGAAPAPRRQREQETLMPPAATVIRSDSVVKASVVQAEIMWKGMSQCLLQGTKHASQDLRKRLCYATLRLADMFLPSLLADLDRLHGPAPSSSFPDDVYFTLCTTFLRGVEFPSLLLSTDHVLDAVELCCNNLPEKRDMVKEMLQASILTLQIDPTRPVLEPDQKLRDRELTHRMLRILSPHLDANPEVWDGYFLKHLDPSYTEYLRRCQQRQLDHRSTSAAGQLGVHVDATGMEFD